MSWAGRLLAKFQRPPRLVVTFRRQDDGGVNVKVAAFTDGAHERERRTMAWFLRILEKGAVEMSWEAREAGAEHKGMDWLWQRTIVLGWVVLHEEELR